MIASWLSEALSWFGSLFDSPEVKEVWREIRDVRDEYLPRLVRWANEGYERYDEDWDEVGDYVRRKARAKLKADLKAEALEWILKKAGKGVIND